MHAISWQNHYSILNFLLKSYSTEKGGTKLQEFESW